MRPIHCFVFALLLTIATEAGANTVQSGEAAMTTVHVSVGSAHFVAVFYDNESARTLLSRMPLTLTTKELNNNEKYVVLPDTLPQEAQRVGTIHAGDIMLYGSDCLVLFYDGFTSSYRYTPLGRIEEVSGLAQALGTGDVQITFTLAGN